MVDETAPRPAASDPWRLKQPFGVRAIAVVAVAVIVLSLSADRTEIPRMAGMAVEGAAHAVGLRESSFVGKGMSRFAQTAFPMVFNEEMPVSRIEQFDRNRLPLFSRIEERTSEVTEFDMATLKPVKRLEKEEVLVRPMGYVLFVCAKMLESLEIAVWGTILAVLIGLPLAFLAAKNYTPHRAAYAVSRGISSFLRAVPELVSALFLVLAFGFGPIAGVLALGLHCGGFFGKFFADDAENADPAPQEALASLGASKLKVLGFAVLPQVLPQYIAYMQYILERNVRMATVIGVVGAGGIGIELKGRFDMFNYGHVTTILLVIFFTVFLLERASQWLRAKII